MAERFPYFDPMARAAVDELPSDRRTTPLEPAVLEQYMTPGSNLSGYGTTTAELRVMYPKPDFQDPKGDFVGGFLAVRRDIGGVALSRRALAEELVLPRWAPGLDMPQDPRTWVSSPPRNGLRLANILRGLAPPSTFGVPLPRNVYHLNNQMVLSGHPERPVRLLAYIDKTARGAAVGQKAVGMDQILQRVERDELNHHFPRVAYEEFAVAYANTLQGRFSNPENSHEATVGAFRMLDPETGKRRWVMAVDFMPEDKSIAADLDPQHWYESYETVGRLAADRRTVDYLLKLDIFALGYEGTVLTYRNSEKFRNHVDAVVERLGWTPRQRAAMRLIDRLPRTIAIMAAVGGLSALVDGADILSSLSGSNSGADAVSELLKPDTAAGITDGSSQSLLEATDKIADAEFPVDSTDAPESDSSSNTSNKIGISDDHGQGQGHGIGYERPGLSSHDIVRPQNSSPIDTTNAPDLSYGETSTEADDADGPVSAI